MQILNTKGNKTVVEFSGKIYSVIQDKTGFVTSVSALGRDNKFKSFNRTRHSKLFTSIEAALQ